MCRPLPVAPRHKDGGQARYKTAGFSIRQTYLRNGKSVELEQADGMSVSAVYVAAA